MIAKVTDFPERVGGSRHKSFSKMYYMGTDFKIKFVGTIQAVSPLGICRAFH